MTSQSLFGEMVLRFSRSPEDLATEALLYILQNHSESWPAIHRQLLRTEIPIPDEVRFRTQVSGKDQSQPDLIGFDIDGNEVLIFESKFWAGLTPNQPVNYLSRLPREKPGLLFVICPGMRFSALWSKLEARIREEGLELSVSQNLDAEYQFARLGETHGFGLLSWGSLLSMLRREAETRGDSSFLGDIDQLSGLCTRMDSDAFLPLSENDVSSEIGRRVQQYADLIDEINNELVAHHGADTKNLTSGGSQSEYGRNFRLSQFVLFLYFAPKLWASYGETPIWLKVKELKSEGSKRISEESKRIKEGIQNLPGTYIKVPESEAPNIVGLELPLRVEKDIIISSLINQIKEVCKFCLGEL